MQHQLQRQQQLPDGLLNVECCQLVGLVPLKVAPPGISASARQYFAEVVVGQWAEDASVDSVFVDEADALICYWSSDPSSPKSARLPTLDDLYADFQSAKSKKIHKTFKPSGSTRSRTTS